MEERFAAIDRNRRFVFWKSYFRHFVLLKFPFLAGRRGLWRAFGSGHFQAGFPNSAKPNLLGV